MRTLTRRSSHNLTGLKTDIRYSLTLIQTKWRDVSHGTGSAGEIKPDSYTNRPQHILNAYRRDVGVWSPTVSPPSSGWWEQDLMSSGLLQNRSLPAHSSVLISVHLACKCRQKVNINTSGTKVIIHWATKRIPRYICSTFLHSCFLPPPPPGVSPLTNQ